MKTISIRLTSPLQSYGNEAQFARRTTGDYPSKSAIVGMLAAALGYQRDDPAINALNDLLFAVRVDQPGQVMTEFQTAEWKPGTRKLTYRDLLQDAVFVVAIGSEDGRGSTGWPRRCAIRGFSCTWGGGPTCRPAC